MKQIRKRMTYANVMSTLAVFLVLGGATAFAAVKIGTKELKAGAVTAAKIKAGAVTAGKIKGGAVTTGKIKAGAVATGKIADDAVTGAKVDESTLGLVPSAESANPEVFAQIGTNGTVDPKLAKGLNESNVTHPGEGVYCITVPAFSPRGGQVTPQFGGTNGTTAAITVGGTGFCPAPAVQVLTFAPGAPPTLSSLAFYVALYH
jgi:hypothetical protein